MKLFQRTLMYIMVAVMLSPLLPGKAHAQAAGEASSRTAIVNIQSSARAQLDWLLEAAKSLPITSDEAVGHLSDALRTPERLQALNQTLVEASAHGALQISSIRAQYLREDTQNFALLTGGNEMWHAVVITVLNGPLQYIDIRPLPSSWDELEQRLSSLASNTGFVAADVGSGYCRILADKDAYRTQPIGSGFKLWVLGALGEAVKQGSASWDEKLAVQDDWKAGNESPVGQLPAGTQLTLKEYATYMMYYSDNSATDHLMQRLGGEAVEQQQWRMGTYNPFKNMPMLTARELLTLKGTAYPDLAEQYLAKHTIFGKRAYLAQTVSNQPLPSAPWREPRYVREIEWFASPSDMCRGFVALEKLNASGKGNQALGEAMSLEGTTGLGLDKDQWPIGWFKGGSEPGVLSRSYYAQDIHGRVRVVSFMINDTQTIINDSARASELLTLAAGSFYLAR